MRDQRRRRGGGGGYEGGEGIKVVAVVWRRKWEVYGERGSVVEA
jgi:hypothetical protein